VRRMEYEIEDFQADVIERSGTVPVLVDFWAEWCGPCRILGPVLERLAERQSGRWVLAKVNSDVHGDIAARYGVQGIPAVKLFVDGEVVREFTGALPEREVERWLSEALPDPHRKSLEAARESMRLGDFRGARSLLEELLRTEPSNAGARVLLAEIRLRDDPARAAELVEPIEPSSDEYSMADAIRTISALPREDAGALPEHPARQPYLLAMEELRAGDFDPALQHLIEALRKDREYHDGKARKAVLAVFRLLGDQHEITRRHYRSFSSALYS
jgi:putative thioredoxin